MSKIIEKAFDAGKKIFRSVFLGSPNLLTSADLNRQMQAFKYQLDMLDDKTGLLIENGKLTTSLRSGTLTCKLEYGHIYFKGCEFKPSSTELTIDLTSSSPVVYMYLTAEQKTVTYADDPTHEIAGAKFADGSSMEAANQLCYANEGLMLSHSGPTSNVENVVGLVAKITLLGSDNIVVQENFNSSESPIRFGSTNKVGNIDPSQGSDYPISFGDTYEEAFRKLRKYLGDGVVHAGTWDAFSQTSDEILDSTVGSYPCSLIDFGPFVVINLTVDSYKVLSSLFLFNMDAGTIAVFHDITDEMLSSKFLGGIVSGKISWYYSNKVIGEAPVSSRISVVSCSEIQRSSEGTNTAVCSFSVECDDIDKNQVTEASGFLDISIPVNVTLVFLRK